MRRTCTGRPAARAVAVGATWSFPDRASTTRPVRRCRRGRGRQVRDALGDRADRRGRGAAGGGRGGAGRGAGRQQLGTRAVQPGDGVGERGRVDRPRVADVDLDQSGEGVGSGRHDPRATRPVPGPVLGGLSHRQHRLRREAGQLVGHRGRVGGVRVRGGREQHRGAERDRGGRGSGLTAGVAVGREHDDRRRPVERGGGGRGQRHGCDGRQHRRGIGRTGQLGATASAAGSPRAPCSPRGRHRSAPVRSPPACATLVPGVPRHDRARRTGRAPASPPHPNRRQRDTLSARRRARFPPTGARGRRRRRPRPGPSQTAFSRDREDCGR